MHPLARAALIALLSLAPLTASAGGASTQTTLKSPAPGVKVYSEGIHRWKPFVDQFPQFVNELSSSSAQLSGYAWQGAKTSLHWDGSSGGDDLNWFNFYADPNTALGKATTNHVCALIDPTAVYTGSVDTSWHGSRGDANGNRAFFYQNGSWHDGSAYNSDCGGNACEVVSGKPVCTSYAAPGNTLSASSYSITPGQSVTLTWDDSAFRDAIVDYSTLDKFGNVAPRPKTSCSASGFTLTGTSYSYCSDAELLDTTPPRWFCNQWSSLFIEDPHGTATVSPTQTTTYSYTCGNANGTTNASATVNVSGASAQPDLTAGGVSPSSAKLGQATTLSATITNGGTASTGAGFPDLFEISQVNNPSLFSQIYATKSYSSAALAAGGSNTASASYTFPSEGTWYVRVCANTDTNGNTPASSYAGTPESSYANNCGSSWTAVTVGSVCFGQGCVSGCDANGTCPTPGCSYSWVGQPKLNPASQCCSVSPGVCPAAPTAALSADPTQVDVGQSSTLFWNSTGATSCSGTGFTAGAASGNRSTGKLNSAGTQNYQVTCSGTGGTSAPAFASVKVLAPNVSIAADPARVKSGGTTTLSWSASGVKHCTVSGPGVSVSGNSDKTNSFSTGSPQTVVISGQSVYTISCTTNGSPISKSITVNVLPGFQEF